MTHNDFSGTADKVLQLGHNHGDLVIQQLPAIPVRERTVPWQVPAPAADFVNRLTLIRSITALLADPGGVPQVVVCSGLRGVGTSATARRIAHLLRERFPGGQLYVDYAALRHAGGAPIEDALAACLRDLGVDDGAIPVSLAERGNLFRSRTANKPIMVVLDDVAEPEQVRALVPNAPGSIVLATSDVLLVELLLEGGHLMELEPLSAADGLTLLAARCGKQRISAEPEAAARLVKLCAGLPVALNVTAARLVTDRLLSVSELVAELTDEGRRLRGLSIRGNRVVTGVFAAAYRNLPAPAALLYRRAGLLPGPDFTAEVAGVLIGLPIGSSVRSSAADEPDLGLNTLVAHQLVQREPFGRFRFHDLVRLHAAEVGWGSDGDHSDHAPVFDSLEPAPDVVLRRVVEYFLARAAQADHAVMGPRVRYTPDPQELGATVPRFPDSATALTWLSAERANLMAVLRAAEERGWLNLVWQLAETLTALFYNQRHLADWYDSGTRGAAAARACGHPEAEARLWMLTSRPMLDLARFDEADRALDRAHELADELGSDLLMGSVWEFRGLRLEGSDPEAAIAAYELSIQFKTAAKRDRGVALSRFLLGALLAAHGRANEAIDLLTRARETFIGLGDERFAARALGALGSAQLKLGDDAQAAALLEEAVRQLAERHAYQYEAQFLEELAAVRERVGDHAGARACLERAVEIYRMFGSSRAERLQARLPGGPADPR